MAKQKPSTSKSAKTKVTTQKSNKKNNTKKKKKNVSKSNFNLNLLQNIFLVIVSIIVVVYVFDKLLSYKSETIKESLKQQVEEESLEPKFPQVDTDDKPVVKELKTPDPTIANRSEEEVFHSSITEYAEKYLNLPLKMGSDPEKDQATDNSHLICAIYNQAAKSAGLREIGYLSMEQILKQSNRISIADLDNGDIIVLKNGMMGMIYGKERADSFFLVYASQKAGKVVSLESTKFKNYWLKQENKQGYYRIKL